MLPTFYTTLILLLTQILLLCPVLQESVVFMVLVYHIPFKMSIWQGTRKTPPFFQEKTYTAFFIVKTAQNRLYRSSFPKSFPAIWYKFGAYRLALLSQNATILSSSPNSFIVSTASCFVIFWF